jgi:RNA polymerase sigma factor (sigma-70 family)
MKNISFLNIQDVHTSLQSNTGKVWDCLYEEAFRKVKAILRATNIDKEDIENIFQDCIAKLWDTIIFKKQDFSDKTNDFYFAILVTCSKNTSKNKYKRDTKFSEIAEMLKYEGQEITDVDELWYKKLEGLVLGNEANILSKNEVMAFRMHFEGYSYEEIANELGMSNQRSATSLKSLAVKKLRDFLKKII